MAAFEAVLGLLCYLNLLLEVLLDLMLDSSCLLMILYQRPLQEKVAVEAVCFIDI
jgi:hypothetical protein